MSVREGDDRIDTAYRSAPKSGSRPRSLVFLPQFRVYFAFIVVAVGLYAARGALSENYTRLAYHHAVYCESSVDGHSGRVMYSECLDTRLRRFDCNDALSEVRKAVHPGPFVHNLEITGAGSDVDARVGSGLTADDAEHLMMQCVPAPDAAKRRGISQTARVEVRGDNYFFPAIIITFFTLLTLLFLPSRLVTVRVDTKIAMVHVRDRAVWRRARTTDCLLSEIEDVAVHKDRVTFVRKDGTPLPLATPDRRPVELQNGTVKRLQTWLADARTWTA